MSRKKTYLAKKVQNQIANRRMVQLFNLAEKTALSGELELADRYVDIARRISMRSKASIPKEFKRRFCKHCYKYLVPGLNSRIRVCRGKIIVYCEHCQKFTRIPIKNNRTDNQVFKKK